MLISSLLLIATDAGMTQSLPEPLPITQDMSVNQAQPSLRSPTQLAPEVNAPEMFSMALGTPASSQEMSSVQAVTAQASAPQPVSPESATSVVWSNVATSSQASSTLRVGSQGQAVAELQHQLQQLGYSISIDGHYGQQTQAAVIQFQQDRGLHADGIAGSATLAALSTPTAAAEQTTHNLGDPANLEMEAWLQSQLAAIEQANITKERWIGLIVLIQIGGWGLIVKDILASRPRRYHRVRYAQQALPVTLAQPTASFVQENNKDAEVAEAPILPVFQPSSNPAPTGNPLPPLATIETVSA